MATLASSFLIVSSFLLMTWTTKTPRMSSILDHIGLFIMELVMRSEQPTKYCTTSFTDGEVGPVKLV